VYVDEAVLAFGTEALLGAGRYGQIELGPDTGNSITYCAGSSPGSGTWKQGDMCFNSNASSGQPMGWMYDGSTWKAMPNL
jgi:hypothetical protein